MNVYQKLMQARLRLQKTDLKKSGHNKFAGYFYFELGDFLPTVQEIFADIGLCGIVSFGPDIATLTITDIESGAFITITSPMGSAALKGCHEVQNIGAVETYQRRYLWVAAMEIVEHDALDATTGAEAPAKRKDMAAQILAGGKHRPVDGIMETLDTEVQEYLRTLAATIPTVLAKDGIEEVCDRLEREALENDQKVAMWSLLDSKTRSAIKKEQERRRLMESDGKAKQADVYRTAEGAQA